MRAVSEGPKCLLRVRILAVSTEGTDTLAGTESRALPRHPTEGNAAEASLLAGRSLPIWLPYTLGRAVGCVIRHIALARPCFPSVKELLLGGLFRRRSVAENSDSAGLLPRTITVEVSA